MLRAAVTSLSQSESSSSVYNYKTLHDLAIRPVVNARTSPRGSEYKRIPSSKSSSSSKTCVSPSLDDLLIRGQWKFRATHDDRLQFKAMGIENLVYTCYDIMYHTREFTTRKQATSNLPKRSSILVQLDHFRCLTDEERAALKREQVFYLMTIVDDAASTHASCSELIRIWREASPRLPRSVDQPKISHELAIRHLLRTPDNQLLQIALHASLITGRSRMDLQEFGEKLGVRRQQFDVGSIRDSTRAFVEFLKFVKDQKGKADQEQKKVNIHKLPYKPRKKRGLNANVFGTKFSVVRQAADVFGFSLCSESDFTSNLIWNDTLISMDIVSSLKPYQKVNHFPMMSEISRKDLLAKNFEKLSRHFPSEYDFTPRTWLLPNEYNVWYSYASTKPKKDACAYILKPNNGAMGHGIQVLCDYERIQPMDNYIVQEYIREPFLIDGYKFDLRIYALLTSCDPLRLFIFNNGLVRMSTEKYETPNRQNASHLFMHLTNYSVNKYNVDYQVSGTNNDGEKSGSKRSLKFLFEYLRAQNLDGTTLWKDIQNIVIKTVFLAQPHLFSAYRMCRPGASPSSESVCFEILGFDILVDRNLKPWVLEVNRCPSFGTNEQIDFDIKMKLLLDTFELLRFRTSDRKKSSAIEKSEAQRRLYSNMTKPHRLIDDNSPLLSHAAHRDLRSHQKKMADVKERLYLFQRETAREIFENRHLGGFIRLLPVEDSIRMNELMNLLGKAFDVLSSNKKDLSWSTKYYNRFKEEELLDQLAQLEEADQVQRQRHSRLAFSAPSSKTSLSSWSYVSLNETANTSLLVDRASPSASFASESSDEEEDEHQSTSPSELTSKVTSSTQIFRLNNSLMKKFGTQTRTNVFRSTSISPSVTRKPRQASLVPTQRPISTLQGSSPNPLRDKKVSVSRLTNTTITEQISPLTLCTKKQVPVQLPTPGRSSSFNNIKEVGAAEQDLTRFYQLTLEQMHQLCIRYPNKSDEETRQVYSEIVDNWAKYGTSLGEFWLTRLDARKRQAILKIVRNNVHQIMKQLWTHEQSMEQLSLTRHFIKLEQRLLMNNGQYLWDICQQKQHPGDFSAGKSSTRCSPIELACCHRFVELSKQALFIVYRYSIDEKLKRQQQQQVNSPDGQAVMVVS